MASRYGPSSPVRSETIMANRETCLVLFALVLIAPPASADWIRVSEVPNATFYTVWVNGDTIAAGSDSTVYVSTDAGATWRGSAMVTANGLNVERVRMRNGRL